MAEEKSNNSYFDVLDIVFADRNKAYGAYALRRSYPKFLGRAMLYSLLVIGLMVAMPLILKSVSEAFAKREKPVDVVAELGPPPDIDPNNPPPPPPPPPPTPPPPTRSTVQFVPPVVKKDEDVQEEPPQIVEEIQKSDADVGKEDKQGNDDAPPALEDNPSDLVVDEPQKQVVEEKTYELFDIQKQPAFPGGEAALMEYLANEIKYPPMARENNIQGVVPISFVVNKDGSISDVQVLRDIGGGCGKESLRVVSNMPKWSPGEANGHKVKVRYTLPVRFVLQ
ncbi:MAG: TonB family protein [Saprospiraceae bacterium]